MANDPTTRPRVQNDGQPPRAPGTNATGAGDVGALRARLLAVGGEEILGGSSLAVLVEGFVPAALADKVSAALGGLDSWTQGSVFVFGW